jgi:hypothetical protein
MDISTSSTEQNGPGRRGFQPDPGSARSRRLARLAEQAEENRVNLRLSERARFWYAVRVALVCVAGCIVGFLPMAWALHTTDVEAAHVAWAVGPVISQIIIIVTLVIAARKWEQDDW